MANEFDRNEVLKELGAAIRELDYASKSLSRALDSGWPISKYTPPTKRPIRRSELERLREEASDVSDRVHAYMKLLERGVDFEPNG